MPSENEDICSIYDCWDCPNKDECEWWEENKDD